MEEIEALNTCGSKWDPHLYSLVCVRKEMKVRELKDRKYLKDIALLGIVKFVVFDANKHLGLEHNLVPLRKNSSV